MLRSTSQKGTSWTLTSHGSWLTLIREDIVTQLRQHGVELWTRLGEWWSAIADHFEPGNTTHDSHFVSMSTSLAKMERNLVAGLADHQAAAV